MLVFFFSVHVYVIWKFGFGFRKHLPITKIADHTGLTKERNSRVSISR